MTFAQIGLLGVVEGYGESKRYDPDIDSHHHFRCTKCNRIVDFHNEQYDNLAVPGDIEERFSVVNKRVVLEGLCDKCKK
jgi:Fur family peroxide stress response transcriptional regulator